MQQALRFWRGKIVVVVFIVAKNFPRSSNMLLAEKTIISKKINVYPFSRAVQNIMEHALKQHKEEDHKGREKHGHKQ